ncbi:MAG: methyltransferase, partial [Halodesulfurarchaeum sp.]
MPVDRSAVRSNAKYLRQVRPIDPEEIADYIPGQPDPRVVRQVLREEAIDLSIVELTDGTFVPVEDGPLRPATDTVDTLPDAYGDALIELLVDRWGGEWYMGESGNRLRRHIRRLKADYYQQNQVEYDFDVALAYAVYHLTNYYAATTYVLQNLASDGRLNRDVSVLDVGAGVGGPAMALHDVYFERDELASPPLVEYIALEPSDAAIVLERMLEKTHNNFHSRIVQNTAESFHTEREYDVIVMANVLSELDDPVSVVETYLDHLTADGTMILLAPADRNTSIQLRHVEREVERGGATVYGPTVRLWPGEQPRDEGWSFDRR